MVSRVYRLILTCFDHQAIDFRIMAAAAALNVILNLVLVPRIQRVQSRLVSRTRSESAACAATAGGRAAAGATVGPSGR